MSTESKIKRVSEHGTEKMLSFPISNGMKRIAPIILGCMMVMGIFWAMPVRAQGGIVPCGNSVYTADDATKGTIPSGKKVGDFKQCDFNDLIRGVQNIINFFMYLSVPLVMIFLAWAGIIYLTAGGDPGKVSDVKKKVWSIVIGFLLMFTAWLIVALLVKVVAEDKKEFNVREKIFRFFLTEKK